jgi:hypothetical protein
VEIMLCIIILQSCSAILEFLSMFTYYYMALSYDAYLPSYYLRRIRIQAYTNKQCYHVITLAYNPYNNNFLFLSSILSLQIRSPTTISFAIDDLIDLSSPTTIAISPLILVQLINHLSSPVTIAISPPILV